MNRARMRKLVTGDLLVFLSVLGGVILVSQREAASVEAAADGWSAAQMLVREGKARQVSAEQVRLVTQVTAGISLLSGNGWP